MGAFGTVTKAAVKLFPWPGPKVIPTEGVQPEKKSILPRDIFKVFVINYPTLEACVEAMRELGEAEIGGVVSQTNVMEFVMLCARSREEFWERWASPFWQRMIHHGHLIMVTLWGFAGPKQVEYEEKVLKQLVADTGGEFIPDVELEWIADDVAASAVRDTNRGRYMRLGPLGGTGGACDSLYDALRSIREGHRIKKLVTPPMGDGGVFDMGNENHKMWVADFGRVVTTAVGSFADKTAEWEKWFFTTVVPHIVKYQNEHHIFSATDAFEASRVGPKYANIHYLIASIKKDLDPNNIASPSRLVDMKAMERINIERPLTKSTGDRR
jgi:hypothetical protein